MVEAAPTTIESDNYSLDSDSSQEGHSIAVRRYTPVEIERESTERLVVPDSHRISCLKCLFSKARDREVALVIVVSVLYFLGVAMSAFPLILLINKRIAGDAEDPDAESVFVYTTVGILHTFMNFLTGRYTSGLGDYVGRKPVLIASMLVFTLSRLVYLSAQTPGAFYVAAVITGSFECFYFSILAWICDLFPDPQRRSKRVGFFVGMCAGFAFVIGVPLGVILALKISVELPIMISALIAVSSAVCIGLLPVDDTLGVKAYNVSTFTRCSRRAVPSDMRAFIVNHFPISAGTFILMKQAKNPLDWLSNFLMHATTGLANLILLQYCLAVYDWTAVQAAASVLSIGVCLAFFSPFLLHRYSTVPVIFYTTIGFTIGLVLLSISGAGLKYSEVLGIFGILFIAVCACWVPAMQSILTSSYTKEVQGTVSGLLSQENDLSLVLSYIMSLGFSYSIRDGAKLYWPGSSWAAVN
jgi:MFS family permease